MSRRMAGLTSSSRRRQGVGAHVGSDASNSLEDQTPSEEA